MAGGVALQAPHSRFGPGRGLLSGALVLTMGLYLMAVVVEVVRVVGSF
jgi:hypothetical protein